MNFKTLVFFLCFVQQLTAQVRVRFTPTYAKKALSFDDFIENRTDSLRIHTLKMYVSNFQFSYKDQVVYTEKESFHLIDFSDSSSIQLVFENAPKKYDAIQFTLGVDSTTTVSGAFGGDLDPTKGMYWTWQSGYIHFKLEGTSTLSKERKQAITYHIGGYAFPFNTNQQVTIPTKGKNTINIDLDVKPFLDALSIEEMPKVMSPCEQANRLASVLISCFSIH